MTNASASPGPRKRSRGPGPSSLALLLAAVALLAGGGAAAAADKAAAPGYIRVLCDENYPPYAFRDEEGRLEGIVVDQWKAWEKATGVSVEILGLPWAGALSAFARGEAEVLDTVFATDERRENWLFTKPYAAVEVPVFIHKSLSGIAGPADLRGLKVAVKDGDAAIGELVRRGVYELSLFPSYEAIIEAAARLDYRVFCVDGPPANYLLYKKRIDRDYRVAFILNRGAFSRAVRKEEAGLMPLVERGFESLPKSAYEAIDRKWMGSELERRIDLRVVALVGGAGAVAIAALFALAWILRRRVARATAELSEKLLLLEASEAKNRAFITALPDFFFVFDKEGRFLEFSSSTPEFLAMSPAAFLGKRMAELGLPAGIAEGFEAKLAEALGTRRMTTYEYELETGAGRRRFEGRIVPLGAERALLVARDVTEARSQEERINASLAEKEILLKEIHHRVKNNMQVISSLIQLQSYAILDERDRELSRETQSRIRAMAAVHELLYRSPDLASIEASDYLRSVSEELALGYDFGNIDFQGDATQLGIDEAVPLGLVANELILNAIKYAYGPGRRGPVEASLRKEGAELVLRVRDEGRGLPPGLDPAASDSMGFTIVRSLAAQLGGSLAFGGPPGFQAELRFVPPPRDRPGKGAF
ncbi:MAG TPA: transporter substrate-binding domain-containing protein [Spirochaetales bacterium]|nr:transporter substrate-binding domain-containing protein [Spirochaetales bacterium]